MAAGRSRMTVLSEEAKAGFPRLRGTHFRANIPVSQDVLNRLLSNAGIQLQVQQHNRLLISYRVFRVAAELVLVTRELDVVLSASWWSRSAIKAALVWKPQLQSYLSQQDRFVSIHCGRISAVRKYEYLWRHISQVHARTVAGRLELDIQVVIT